MVMGPRTRRILLVAFLFASTSLYQQILHRGDVLLRSLGRNDADADPDPDAAATRRRDVARSHWANVTSDLEREAKETKRRARLSHVRLPGDAEGLLEIFDELTDPSSDRRRRLPTTPREIAERYGVPETSRDVRCEDGEAVTIGWIPSVANRSDVNDANNNNTNRNNNSASSSSSSSSSGFSHQGRIPRLIFQSWKTNSLSGDLCRLAKRWSESNPEYDYFLFDDDAIDSFVIQEYGREVFAAYACVAVGAAKCDVWRILVEYLFGGIYFDADVRPIVPFREWDWGEERDVVTARSCTAARARHPGGCAHQWGLVYAPRHPVILAAGRETLRNLAERQAETVYDVSFWSYYNAWRNGPYNQSYMPGWGEEMGGRVSFQDDGVKDEMVKDNGHWQTTKKIWHPECLP